MQNTQHMKLCSARAPRLSASVVPMWRASLVVCVLLVSACGWPLKAPPSVDPATIDHAVGHTIGRETEPLPVKTLPVAKKRTQNECAIELPLYQRAGQLMFPLVTQIEFADATELASKGLIGGVVVLGSPSAPIREDIALYQKQSLLGPGIIAVDEEGGRVQRLAALTSRVPSARKVAQSLGLGGARQLASEHATAIGNLGFTMNLAPVADLNNSPAVGDRAYGRHPAVVTSFAMATANGILDAGLVPVLKHFPGHGSAADSHHALPIIPPVSILRKTDLVPFVEAASRTDIPIMMGHLVIDGLTGGQPASVSAEAVNGLLRGELGFEGLVITDAFNMDAISSTMTNSDAAELAIAAGVDLVMLGSLGEARPTLERLVEAVNSGRIKEASITESFLRVMQTRAIDVCELPNA